MCPIYAVDDKQREVLMLRFDPFRVQMAYEKSGAVSGIRASNLGSS